MLRELEAQAEGSLRPLLLIPDEAVNDAWYVQLSDEFSVGYTNIDVREMPLAFDELSGGPPNG
jgi:hypothetical protein